MLVRTHILICDADRDRRAKIVSYFDLEDYRVSAVDDLAQLRRVVETEAVDLVVLDIAAPDDGALDLAGELHQRPETGIIPLGNSDDLVDRVAGLEAGADDFLSPPLNMRELLARVHSVLRRMGRDNSGADPARYRHRRDPVNNVLAFEGWNLDMRSRHLSNESGAAVELSTGEFDMLQILIANAGRPVTRDILAGHWKESDGGAEGRSVDVRIGRLRHKIERNPQNPAIIRTARGIGYVFAGKLADAGA